MLQTGRTFNTFKYSNDHLHNLPHSMATFDLVFTSVYLAFQTQVDKLGRKLFKGFPNLGECNICQLAKACSIGILGILGFCYVLKTGNVLRLYGFVEI